MMRLRHRDLCITIETPTDVESFKKAFDANYEKYFSTSDKSIPLLGSKVVYGVDDDKYTIDILTAARIVYDFDAETIAKDMNFKIVKLKYRKKPIEKLLMRVGRDGAKPVLKESKSRPNKPPIEKPIEKPIVDNIAVVEPIIAPIVESHDYAKLVPEKPAKLACLAQIDGDGAEKKDPNNTLVYIVSGAILGYMVST